MGGDAGDGDLRPDEAAVGGADLSFGGLGHDGRIDVSRVEPGQHLLDTQAGVLLVGDGGHDDLSVDARPHCVAACGERGGEAGFHVVGAASIEAVVRHARGQGVAGTGQADRVEVAAEQQPAPPGVAAAAQDDAGATGCALDLLDAQAHASAPLRDEGRDLCLARAAGVEPGIDRVDADQGIEQIEDRHAGRGHGWFARRRTALASTSVPFAQAAALEYSRGVWLMPPFSPATKTIAAGQMAAISWASCPAPDMART